MPRKGNRCRAKNRIIWDSEKTLEIEQPYNPENRPDWLVKLKEAIGFVEQENTSNDVEIMTVLMIQKFGN